MDSKLVSCVTGGSAFDYGSYVRPTLAQEIIEEMTKFGDRWQDVEKLDYRGDANKDYFNYDTKFTAWTKQRVYFPATDDGCEYIASAPRNPPEAR